MTRTSAATFDEQVAKSLIDFSSAAGSKIRELASNDGELAKELCQSQLIIDRVFAKVMEKKQLEEIRAAGIEDLVQCPACNYAVIVPEDTQDRVLTCGNTDCGRQTCRLCGEEVRFVSIY